MQLINTLEMLVVYEKLVVSVAGLDLLETVTKNTGELAVTLAEGLDTTQLVSLKVESKNKGIYIPIK